jgi:FdhE protein
VKQGGAPPTGKWIGEATGGVKAPEPLILPDPATRFARMAARLLDLSSGHPMEDWLVFLARLAEVQHHVATTLGPRAELRQAAIDQAVAARFPPLAADTHRRNPIWRSGLVSMLDRFADQAIPPRAQDAIVRLRACDDGAIEAFADGFLFEGLDSVDAGAALYVAAALQVYFTCTAAALPAASLRLLPQRGLCPCCGSTPIAGVITASGHTPGSRYLYCSLCSTAWNHVRAVCITCGDSRTVSQRGIEGDNGAAKAETCDACHTYAKMLYQLRDTKLNPFADDLATLGLDLMVAESGWSRHAANPWLLVG